MWTQLQFETSLQVKGDAISSLSGFSAGIFTNTAS